MRCRKARPPPSSTASRTHGSVSEANNNKNDRNTIFPFYVHWCLLYGKPKNNKKGEVEYLSNCVVSRLGRGAPLWRLGGNDVAETEEREGPALWPPVDCSSAL